MKWLHITSGLTPPITSISLCRWWKSTDGAAETDVVLLQIGALWHQFVTPGIDVCRTW